MASLAAAGMVFGMALIAALPFSRELEPFPEWGVLCVGAGEVLFICSLAVLATRL